MKIAIGKNKYLIALYRFASIAAKADNKITEDEQQWLSELLKLSNSKPEEKLSEICLIDIPM